jgi:hypothetical protein
MPQAFLPAASGLPEPMGRRQNPQIGLTDTLTNRNTSALRKTGIWSGPLFAWSKPVFDQFKARSRGFENSPFRLRQFKALILRFAKIDWQKPF